MITELTQEQKDLMPVYAEKWIGIGTNTDRFDYDTATDVVHELQTHVMDTEKTPVVIFDNPIEAWVALNYRKAGKPINDLKKHTEEFFNTPRDKSFVLESFSYPYFMGSFDASIFSYYQYMRDVLNVDYGEYDKKYKAWENTHKLGMIFPYGGLVAVAQKPTKLALNAQRAVHCSNGPAISYAGYGDLNIHCLNGTNVPGWMVETHSSKLEISRYNELSNADQKMEFVRLVGIERMLSLGHKLDDYTKYEEQWWTKSEYELWDMHNLFPGVEYAPHLKMLNQTTGVWHVEAVSPTCRTLKDAIFDRLGGDFEIVGVA